MPVDFSSVKFPTQYSKPVFYRSGEGYELNGGGESETGADSLFSGIGTFAHLPFVECFKSNETFDIAFLGSIKVLHLPPSLVRAELMNCCPVVPFIASPCITPPITTRHQSSLRHWNFIPPWSSFRTFRDPAGIPSCHATWWLQCASCVKSVITSHAFLLTFSSQSLSTP